LFRHYVPPFTFSPSLGSLRRVLSSGYVTIAVTGAALYDYYGFICNLSALPFLSPSWDVVQSPLLRCHWFAQVFLR
jgi:hypothetical protein